jgi:hypothetical protein
MVVVVRCNRPRLEVVARRRSLRAAWHRSSN